MDVTWLGHGCFRLRGRSAAVVTDPYPPSLGPKLPKLEADLVTVSHQHENHSYTSAVSKEPFVPSITRVSCIAAAPRSTASFALA